MSAARVLTLSLGLFFLIVPVLPGQETPAQQPNESIWQDDWAAQEAQRSEAMANRIFDSLKEKNPQREAELRKLYKESPDRFWQEVRKEFSQQEQNRPPRWEDRLKRRHEELIQWLEKNDPEFAAQLTQLKEKDPEAYLNKSNEARRRYEPIMQAQRDNPPLAKVLLQDLDLQKQQDVLLRKVRTAQGADKEAQVKELEKLTSARFDLIVQKKQLMYEDLQKRLEKLQQEIEKRQSELNDLKTNKQKNVEERIRELVSQSEKINWD